MPWSAHKPRRAESTRRPAIDRRRRPCPAIASKSRTVAGAMPQSRRVLARWRARAGAPSRARRLAAMRSTSSARRAGRSGTTSVTAGRPTVSVPVLSTTSVSMRPARSSAAALRMSTPARAPAPLPTMIAVGVARPSAQGQAITSTATARDQRGRARSPVIHHVRANVSSAITTTTGTKTPRHGVGEALDRRLRALRFLDQPDDARERGVRADAGRAAAQQPCRVERAGIDARAGVLRDRQAFAGQHRFVDARPAFEHDAVDRDGFARPHDEHVADANARRRASRRARRRVRRARSRLEPDQLLDRRGRARLRARFEQLAEQHERDDRRCSLRNRRAAAGRARPRRRCRRYAMLVPSAISTSMFAPPPRRA